MPSSLNCSSQDDGGISDRNVRYPRGLHANYDSKHGSDNRETETTRRNSPTTNIIVPTSRSLVVAPAMADPVFGTTKITPSDLTARRRPRTPSYRDSETVSHREANEQRYSKAKPYWKSQCYKEKDPLAIRLSGSSDALHVDTSYKPLKFHWMDVCQEKFDFANEYNSLLSLSAKADNGGKLRSLREITLPIVVDHCTSLTADVLQQVHFLPVGQLILEEIVRQGKDSLRVYRTFVERFPSEMSEYNSKQANRNKGHQAVRRLKLSPGLPHDFADHIGGCMNWLVYVDIYDVTSATVTRDGLLSLLHIPALVGLKFGVRTRQLRFGTAKDAPILDDRMLKTYASAMKLDGRWQWLRALIIICGDGNRELRGVTQEGMNAIMGVRGRLRYVECHQDLIPVSFRKGRLVRGKLVGEDDGRPGGGWMSLRAWPVNYPAALHWKCMKIAKIVHDQISELDHKTILDVSIATPPRWYKTLEENEGAKENDGHDFIINGYVLSCDDRSGRSGKRLGEINNEVEMNKRRRGIVPKRRTNTQSVDQLMATFSG
ncbi:hypothetical protein V1522DRAFT_227923 [Lipomyces starkeyi]